MSVNQCQNSKITVEGNSIGRGTFGKQPDCGFGLRKRASIWILAVLLFGILSLVGIVQSLMGNYWKMPVIGDIAEKISI